MTEDELGRIDSMTKLDPPNHFEPQETEGNALSSLALICIGIIIGMLILAGVKSCDKKEVMRMAEVHRL